MRITQPFYLGRTEVTQAEWKAVMGDNPSRLSREGGQDTTRFPVDSVSWYDAVEFCKKLSIKESLPPFYRLTIIERESNWVKKADFAILGGKGYRLPTEAEWEYACRAGTTTRFHFGDASNGTQANVNGTEPLGTTTKGPFLDRATTVGSYFANAFGLVDMHGNVCEWCQDWYDPAGYKPFASRTVIDPEGPDSDKGSRVYRGGGDLDAMWRTRSAQRDGSSPGLPMIGSGFRIARTP